MDKISTCSCVIPPRLLGLQYFWDSEFLSEEIGFNFFFFRSFYITNLSWESGIPLIYLYSYSYESPTIFFKTNYPFRDRLELFYGFNLSEFVSFFNRIYSFNPVSFYNLNGFSTNGFTANNSLGNFYDVFFLLFFSEQITFMFGFFAVIFGLFCVLQKKPIMNLYFFTMTALMLSGIFLFFGLEFLAFSMIILYVGTVVVMFIFVLMMLSFRYVGVVKSTGNLKKNFFEGFVVKESALFKFSQINILKGGSLSFNLKFIQLFLFMTITWLIMLKLFLFNFTKAHDFDVFLSLFQGKIFFFDFLQSNRNRSKEDNLNLFLRLVEELSVVNSTLKNNIKTSGIANFNNIYYFIKSLSQVGFNLFDFDFKSLNYHSYFYDLDDLFNRNRTSLTTTTSANKKINGSTDSTLFFYDYDEFSYDSGNIINFAYFYNNLYGYIYVLTFFLIVVLVLSVTIVMNVKRSFVYKV